MNKLYFVSTNKKKIAEAEMILGFPIEAVSLDLFEPQDSDVEKIVKKKAQDAYEKLKKPLIVDDVGFYVAAWNGFPGPFIKFILQAGGCQLLLKMLGTEENRKVEVKCMIGFHDGQTVHTFVGKIEGTIPKEVNENNEAWFDSIFIPDGYTKTFTEMSLDEKNSLSHRKKALELFRIYLQKNHILFS